jgi:glycosyltransferase involved in cell wall biosynthesis
MSPSFDRTFTVFTATYDRAATLPRLKLSLEAQTFQDFEWVIVDDGSTDGTAELVEGWRKESALEIQYIRQEHAGKHVAFNNGVRRARGRLFASVDSDDECVPNALERLLHHWDSIPRALRGSFSAVSALAMRDNGEVVGDGFPTQPWDSDSLHKYFASVGQGDKWGFHRTDVLREFPFPEPAGLEFVSEAVVWFAIARRFRTRYVNEPLLIVHSDAPGERLHRLTRRTTGGRLLFHQDIITKYLDFMTTSPWLVLRSGINYCRYSFHMGRWPLRQIMAVETATSKLFIVALMLPGAVVFARDIVAAHRATNCG